MLIHWFGIGLDVRALNYYVPEQLSGPGRTLLGMVGDKKYDSLVSRCLYCIYLGAVFLFLSFDTFLLLNLRSGGLLRAQCLTGLFSAMPTLGGNGHILVLTLVAI